MFVETRDESRQFFLKVWSKMSRNEALQPLEAVIARIIGDHPEYHVMLDQPEAALDREFHPGGGATNPFLHLGLHVALIEQLQSDRPPGITDLYRRLLLQERGDAHALDHRIMECLAAVLWRATSADAGPDESAYLASVRKMLR